MTSGERVTVLEHPAVADRLARIRDKTTSTPLFRKLVEEVGTFLAYEATRALPLREGRVESPVAGAAVSRIDGRPVVAPILRAGLGLLPGFLQVVDDAVVAHLGFYRDPDSLRAVPYYANVPPELGGRHVFLLDPMLATGNSGVAALEELSQRGAQDVTFISIIAAPEGIENVRSSFPRARIVTCAVDSGLNAHGYIVPGLGDAGDRMFGSLSSVPSPRHA